MNERLEAMRNRVRNREQRKWRLQSVPDIIPECEVENLSWTMRAARLTRRQCEAEFPVIEPDQKIAFTRTVPGIAPLYLPEEWEAFFAGRSRHESGPISNICADWGMVLSQGLSGRKAAAEKSLRSHEHDRDAVEFLTAAIETMDAVLDLAARYEKEAERIGRMDLAIVLSRVPAFSARNFHEALQSLRLLHAAVWMSGNYHVGLGRFDQYMWPYLRNDLQSGALSLPKAEELLAEFFISLNRDSDLYPGVQQGDNGQSLMLGGVTRQGKNAVNELTHIVLRVARDVAMIDPKINLRINADTDKNLLMTAARLTQIGLGFPQYSNDDVIIPALTAMGYDLKDARDYTVAACWEFIIPGKGMEVVNIGAVSFPLAAHEAIVDGLTENDRNFENIMDRVERNIDRQIEQLARGKRDLLLPPAPFYSVLMTGCLEQGRDISQGAAYNNYGIHGAACSSAADALINVKKFVFEDKCLSSQRLLNALETDFKGFEDVRQLLATGQKVGCNDEAVDSILTRLFSYMADACDRQGDNSRGGRFRPGSGSAMYYLWLARDCGDTQDRIVGATADGRRKESMFAANLAPSPGAQVRGPISVLQSFAKIDYHRICNGGPITMELSQTIFSDDDALEKVALFIRTFAQLGCQQLQLNTLNPETLKDALEHPENHKNLIVRVWGWSGYFCELSPEYQEQIISRHTYAMN